jgi:quinol monooxygenase YgiN
MVHLIVTLPTTASAAPRLVAALKTLMPAIRVEPGFLECRVWTTEREDEQGILVHYEERWSDELAMQARVRSERFTKLLEVVEGAPESPRVEFEFVSRRLGLEYVESVRGTPR